MLTLEQIFERILELMEKSVFDPASSSKTSDFGMIEREELADMKQTFTEMVTIMGRDAIPPMPEIYIGFVDTLNMNAFAEEHIDEGAFIGINRGCYTLLQIVFSRMLAHPNVLTNIGDVSKELPPLPKLPMLSNKLYEVASASGVNTEFTLITPQCEIRHAYANLLLELAMEYIVFHEYAHIRNGHCAYIDKKRISLTKGGTACAIDELFLFADSSNMMQPADEADRQKQKLYQTFEFNADSAAIPATLEACLRRMESPEFVPENQRTAFSTPEAVLKTWLLSIGTVVALFGLSWPKDTDILAKGHPPASFRFALLITLAQEYCSRQSDKLNASYLHVLGTFVLELTHIFAEITEQDMGLGSDGGIAVALSDIGNEHLRELRTYWATTVHPLVEEFAHNSSPS